MPLHKTWHLTQAKIQSLQILKFLILTLHLEVNH